MPCAPSVILVRLVKEKRGKARIEDKAWWQLNKNRPALVAESGHFVSEPPEKVVAIREAALMGDGLGELYRETKAGRNAGGPARIGCGSVRAIKASS